MQVCIELLVQRMLQDIRTYVAPSYIEALCGTHALFREQEAASRCSDHEARMFFNSAPPFGKEDGRCVGVLVCIPCNPYQTTAIHAGKLARSGYAHSLLLMSMKSP